LGCEWRTFEALDSASVGRRVQNLQRQEKLHWELMAGATAPAVEVETAMVTAWVVQADDQLGQLQAPCAAGQDRLRELYSCLAEARFHLDVALVTWEQTVSEPPAHGHHPQYYSLHDWITGVCTLVAAGASWHC
jgi:hypothetical protein